MRNAGSAVRRTVVVTVGALVLGGAAVAGARLVGPQGTDAGTRSIARPVAAAQPASDLSTGLSTDSTATGAAAEPGADTQTPPGPTKTYKLASEGPKGLGPKADQGSIGGLTYVRAKVPAGADRAALADLLARYDATTKATGRRTGLTTFAVPDADASAFMAALRRLPTTAGVTDVATEQFGSLAVTPNDPRYASQASYLDLVAAPKGWDVEQGVAATKIAVLDTGVDVTHPDLKSKVVGTYNAVDGSSDVTDTDGHGTFVAGVAAAATNNGVGVAGVGWNSSLLAVKVEASSGLISAAAISEGMHWAADNGARVINISIVFRSPDPVLADAVTYAQGKGVLVVAAAGNDGLEGNVKMYPAGFPGVVAVGATDGKYRAPFSEYGSWVTMAAPGVNITSTSPVAGGTTMTGRSYDVGDGTSFAAPQVAGAAALLFGREPKATRAQVRAALVSTASGFKGYGLGAGRLHVQHALWVLVPQSTPTITSPAAGATLTGPAVNLAATGLPTASRGAWYVDGVLLGTSTGSPFRFSIQGWPNGSHTLEFRACSISKVCQATGPKRTVTFDVPPPTITQPADGATVSGRVPLVFGGPESERGAVWVDGVRVGIVSSTSSTPGAIDFSRLADGKHTIQVRACSLGTNDCNGTPSAAVTVTSRSLHPTAKAAYVSFSPNGDGYKDTVPVTYTLPTAQTVVATIHTADGTEVRRVSLGRKAAGTYSFTWDGKNAVGARFDGTYQVRFTTSEGALAGFAAATVRVDTTRPVTTVLSWPEKYYPVKDGYLDSGVITFRTSERASFTLTVRNSAGKVVRRTTAVKNPGNAVTMSWDGKTSSGAAAPSGAYTFRIVTADPVGLTATSGWRTISLSRKKLVTKTVTVTRKGTAAYGVGNGRACATATDIGSSFTGGLWIKNNCAKNLDAPFPAFAVWKVTVPAAVSYSSFTVSTKGRSHSQPAVVGAGVFSTMTNYYEMPYPLRKVTTNATGTITVGKVGGPGHAPGRKADVMLYVLNVNTPLNDWDVATLRLTVTYRTLA